MLRSLIMINLNPQFRSQWSSATSYLLVTLGAIVGLGNIIQFPYLVTKYGGLFFIFFIICEILISVPLLFAELLIGRRGKQNPVGSIALLSLESNGSRHWQKLGWLSVCVCFFILSYYSVNASFPLAYFLGSINVISLYGADEPSTIAVHGNLLTQFWPIEICFILYL